MKFFILLLSLNAYAGDDLPKEWIDCVAKIKDLCPYTKEITKEKTFACRITELNKCNKKYLPKEN